MKGSRPQPETADGHEGFEASRTQRARSELPPSHDVLEHVVRHSDDELDHLFGALADSTRRAMIGRLTCGSAPIGELADPFEMSFAAASKHVRVLERAGIVRREIRGRQHFCSLDTAALMRALEWLAFHASSSASRLNTLEHVTSDMASPGRATNTEG